MSGAAKNLRSFLEVSSATNQVVADVARAIYSPGPDSSDSVQSLAPFQPYLDPGVFDFDTSFLTFEQFNSGAELDDSEMWLGLQFDT